MKTAALVRCMQYGPEEQRLVQRLSSYFPGDVYLVVDAMTKAPADGLPPNTVLLTREFCVAAGLRVFHSVGWRCGDYAFYAARSQLPGYDYFWLIEPDVEISFPAISDFFDVFATRTDDYIAPSFGKRQAWWMWHKYMAPIVGEDAVYGSLFPISRISAPAIDNLLRERAAMMAAMPIEADNKTIPNDESFTASILHRDGFSCIDARQLMPPGTFASETFSTAMLIMPEEVTHPSLANRVMHSVRSGEGAKGRMKGMRLKAPAQYAKMRERVIANVGAEAWERWIEPSLA